MEPLPVQYHLEIYERSFANDLSVGFACSTPLPALSIGDQFEHRMSSQWYDPPTEGEVFRVKDIQHIFWEIEKSHIGYKLMVCLEKCAVRG